MLCCRVPVREADQVARAGTSLRSESDRRICISSIGKICRKFLCNYVREIWFRIIFFYLLSVYSSIMYAFDISQSVNVFFIVNEIQCNEIAPEFPCSFLILETCQVYLPVFDDQVKDFSTNTAVFTELLLG
ncbi:MAG: hypothetical protein A2277_10580 [Desulfobacterales bacterium RIFOXYA12_FULL_46_15]|nr:MAG: hypothetical protein A2277_10580 [Desulfobacterales bacterium RIFOXYA12_FULL_46_15]